MRFNESLLLRRRDDLNERGVRVRFIGRRGGRVPRRVAPAHRRHRGAHGEEPPDDAHVRVQLRRAGRDRRRGAGARPRGRGGQARARQDRRERTIARHLYAPDMPDPDLLVRTSGEFRISNYLLWQVAYSELVFTDVLWPDFRREDLFDAIREYQGRSRRFGAIDEQS